MGETITGLPRSAEEKTWELLSLLSDVQPSPGKDSQWLAVCPGHDDSKPSLSIGVGHEGRLLLHCFAGCTTSHVLKSLNLPITALFPDRPKSTRTANRRQSTSSFEDESKIVAKYDYMSESDELVFQVVRFEPKNFRQRRPKPDGRPGWIWSVKDSHKVPYRLPELLKSSPETPIYIVEGEKDADQLAALGLVATTNAGGAGKWLATPAFTEPFHGRNVIVLPDNDESGRKHSEDVARKLHKSAASIKIVRLPALEDKGDVSDWIAAGGTLEQLLNLVAQTSAWTYKIDPEDYENAVRITNFRTVKDGDTKTDEPLSMQEICQKIYDVTSLNENTANLRSGFPAGDDGPWPRRIGGQLFIHHRKKIFWLDRQDALFGWLGSVTHFPPKFSRNPDCHTMGQVFCELKRTAENYLAIEHIPHEPPIPDHYYACEPLEPGDGSALQGLIQRYSPASPLDADLMAAMFASAIWGGRGGTRPAFLITAESGRGAGKSTLAHHVALLAGGGIDLSSNEDVGVIKQRLLSPEGLQKRVAILDNVKSLKFSWSELESLITSPFVSGKQLYVGETSRMNNIVWIITLNGVSLSKDLAQRCVILKIGHPSRQASWAEETVQFIEQNRNKIIADCIALLRSERFPLPTYSRWSSWERDVLERLPDPLGAQQMILDRQQLADIEEEESGLIQEFFETELKKLHYDTRSDRIFIPSILAAEWYALATREKVTTTAASRRLSQAIAEGTMTLLEKNKCNTYGRGFVWNGPLSSGYEKINTDIEARASRGF